MYESWLDNKALRLSTITVCSFFLHLRLFTNIRSKKTELMLLAILSTNRLIRMTQLALHQIESLLLTIFLINVRLMNSSLLVFQLALINHFKFTLNHNKLSRAQLHENENEFTLKSPLRNRRSSD